MTLKKRADKMLKKIIALQVHPDFSKKLSKQEMKIRGQIWDYKVDGKRK